MGDGTYRNDVLPYPMQVIQSMALPRGKARHNLWQIQPGNGDDT